MRIGNAQPFQHPLDTAVFAPTAVKRVEDRIWTQFRQIVCQTGPRIDLGHIDGGRFDLARFEGVGKGLTIDEDYQYDREDEPWAKSQQELDELWCVIVGRMTICRTLMNGSG